MSAKYANEIYDSEVDLIAELNLSEGVHHLPIFKLDDGLYTLVYIVAIVHDDGRAEIVYNGGSFYISREIELETWLTWKIKKHREEIAERS